MQAASLDVQLGSRSYPIHIGRGLLDDASLFTRLLGDARVAVVTNTTVAPLYLERVRAVLGERVALVKILPDGEEHKNLSVLSDLYDALLSARCDRNCTLVALGGGVVGDITGFAAATYQRGVSFVQIPTTLLAQVDSSVGGKTAVNHPRGKNMIGAFHQPRAVIADIDTLSTLPVREYAAGLAEVLKYGLIGDAPFHAWISANAAAIAAREAAGETMDNRLIRIEEAVIVSAAYEAPMARITVRFAADIAAVTRDKDGNVIAGSLDDAIESRDVWTFSRNVTARDPNWLLDETDEG